MAITSPPYKFALALQGLAADLPAGTDYPQETLFWATDTTTLYVNDGTTFNAAGGSGGTITDITSTGVSIDVTAPTGPTTNLEVDTAWLAANAVISLDGTGGPLEGAVTLSEGANVTLTQTGQNIEIGSTGDLPSWFQFGSGSPAGTVVPSQQGAVYQDILNGAFYEAVGPTDTDWVSVGGNGDQTIVGVSATGSLVFLICRGDSQAYITDTAAFAGSGNGLFWNGNSADGSQTLQVQTGGPGTPLIGTIQDANGNMAVPGGIDAASLGPTIPYATVQAGPPAGPYQTPLVFDSTLVTGGLYGWDGSAYQQIGGPL